MPNDDSTTDTPTDFVVDEFRADITVIKTLLEDNRPLEALKHTIETERRLDEHRESSDS